MIALLKTEVLQASEQRRTSVMSILMVFHIVYALRIPFQVKSYFSCTSYQVFSRVDLYSTVKNGRAFLIPMAILPAVTSVCKSLFPLGRCSVVEG